MTITENETDEGAEEGQETSQGILGQKQAQELV